LAKPGAKVHLFNISCHERNDIFLFYILFLQFNEINHAPFISFFAQKTHTASIRDRKAKATFLTKVAFEEKRFCAYKGVWVSPNLFSLILDTFF
jgi:hypothetical protein